VGLRAFRGGAIAVGVYVERDAPRVALSSFVSTAAESDRLALEPYHVAAELARVVSQKTLAEAEAAVREGRKRQDALAAAGLRVVASRLEDAGFVADGAALLVNRAGWVTDLLRYSLATPEHPAVAEGLAVRDAFRHALHENKKFDSSSSMRRRYRRRPQRNSASRPSRSMRASKRSEAPSAARGAKSTNWRVSPPGLPLRGTETYFTNGTLLGVTIRAISRKMAFVTPGKGSSTWLFTKAMIVMPVAGI
jgi:hypothetical protein